MPAFDRTMKFELRNTCAGVDAAGRIGVVRLLDPWDFRRESSSGADRSAALMYGAQPWKALCAMVRALDVTAAEFERLPPLRSDVPMVVLSAGTSDNLLPAGHLIPADLQRRGALGGLLRTLRP